MKPIVKVTWVDSCSHSAWKSSDYVAGIAQCVTVGFLHEDMESHVTVALSLHHDDVKVVEISDVISIPRAAVLSITPLDVVEKL